MSQKKEIYAALVAYLGGPKAAASALGVKQPTASGWANGVHGMSAATAIRAEKITGGMFLATDLNDDLRDVDRVPAA